MEHKGSQIGPMEDEKSGIIPNRNAELILSAAMYGERIYFGVIKDEINSDKSLDDYDIEKKRRPPGYSIIDDI